jgi:hypothetical protein
MADPYLRVHAMNVYVKDQLRSLDFYLNSLEFQIPERSLHSSKGTSQCRRLSPIMSMSLDGYVADLNDGVADVSTGTSTQGTSNSAPEGRTPRHSRCQGRAPSTFAVSGPDLVPYSPVDGLSTSPTAGTEITRGNRHSYLPRPRRMAATQLDSPLRETDGTPAVLGYPTVIPGVGVTHVRYRYARRGPTPTPFSPGGERCLDETFTRDDANDVSTK